MRGERVGGDVFPEHFEANEPADNTYHYCSDTHNEIGTTRPVTTDYADQSGHHRADAQQHADNRAHGASAIQPTIGDALAPPGVAGYRKPHAEGSGQPSQ